MSRKAQHMCRACKWKPAVAHKYASLFLSKKKKKRACIKQATPTKKNRGENRFSSFAKPKHKNSARVLLLLLRSTERRLRQNEWRKRKRTSSVKPIDIKSEHSLRNFFIFEQLSTGVGSWIRTTRKISLAPSP